MHDRAFKLEVQLHRAREETEKIVSDFNAAVRRLVPVRCLLDCLLD